MFRITRKLIVIAAASAALLAAYAAAGFWLVPRLVRSQALQFADENYQRTLAIGEVRFNPFTFVLEVDRFSFPDADGEPLASFDTLLVNLELSSLWRAGASFKEISIGKPYIRPVIRPGGELNFADLAKPFPETPEDEAEDEGPPRLFIALFRMTDGHAHFEDRTLATPYATDLKPLSLELRDFSTTADTDNAYDLHAQAGSGATLDWSGEFSLAPLASKGRFKFANIACDEALGLRARVRRLRRDLGHARLRRRLRFPRRNRRHAAHVQPARARHRRARHPPHRRRHRHRALRAA